MSTGEKSLKILVVEDEPLIGMNIEYAIEQLGYLVLGPVADLNVALDLATDDTIGCAILDINIRGGNSYPVAELLLDRCVPVLLLTGYSSHILPERMQKLPRLPKPFTCDQLESEIRALVTQVANLDRSENPEAV